MSHSDEKSSLNTGIFFLLSFNLDWGSCIDSVTKAEVFIAIKFFSRVILYLYKSKTQPSMEYFCDVRAVLVIIPSLIYVG